MQWAGETEYQRTARETKWHRAYLIWPRQMEDGRWVWLETVWRRMQRLPNMNFVWRYSADVEPPPDGPKRPGPPKPETKPAWTGSHVG